ncbi:MAG: hypothetical protein JNL11_16570 [Bdellovibrionaceae bacterium]|nr:hypothetical protein [Pseudobdellovibrionaceae bacterium]
MFSHSPTQPAPPVEAPPIPNKEVADAKLVSSDSTLSSPPTSSSSDDPLPYHRSIPLPINEPIQKTSISPQKKQSINPSSFQTHSPSVARVRDYDESDLTPASSSPAMPPTAPRSEAEPTPHAEGKDDSFFVIKFFGGFNYCSVNQSTLVETENGNFSQQTLSQIGISVNLNLSPKSILDFTHRRVEAPIPTQGETTLDKAMISRAVTTFGLNYMFKEMLSSSYALILAFKNAWLPMLSTDVEKSVVNVYTNEANSVGVGIQYNYKLKENVNWYAAGSVFKLIHARSQNRLPLDMNDQLQFNASIGMNTRISKRLEIGIAFENDQSQFQYTTHRNNSTSSGKLGLNETSVLIKMGLHF